MRLAFLTNDLGGSYQLATWRGANRAARELNANLLAISMGEIMSPTPSQVARNRLARMLDGRAIDGALLLSPILFNHVDEATRVRWIDQRASLPMVSIGFSLQGIPSVTIDQESGWRDLVRHLADVHGLRRFAYLGGASHNLDSRQRRSWLIEELHARGLGIREEAMPDANWDWACAQAATRRLLALDPRPQAIVAANDLMALAAIDCIREHGLRVPRDIVVTGMDDTEDAVASDPPLSTVRQPVEEQAEAACHLLADMIQGSNAPSRVVLPSRMRLRRSCGCLPEEIDEGGLIGDRPAWKSTLLQAGIGSNLDPGETWSRILEDGRDASHASLAIAALRTVAEEVRALPGIDPTAVDRSLLAGVARLGQQSVDLAQRDRLDAERGLHGLTQLAHDVAHSFDESLLADALSEGLGRIDVTTCVLIRELPSLADRAARGRVLLAMIDGIRLVPQPSWESFDLCLGFPEDLPLWSVRRSLLLDALFFHDEPLGVLALEMRPRSALFHEALRIQIGTALKGAVMVRELVERAFAMERLASSLDRRSRELEMAIAALEANQKQLLAAETMASLGRLTAGMAHEMNTPLAAALTSLQEARILSDEYAESVGDPDVSLDDHREIARDLAFSVRLADQAVRRAAGFVRGIRNRTRGPGTDAPVEFSVVDQVRETLLLLDHHVRDAGCSLRVESPDIDLRLRGTPHRLGQIVTNLVTNAADACRGRTGAEIVVKIQDEGGGGVCMQVIDNGPGIEAGDLPRLFDPFFTRKSVGEGSGLGLGIVRDIVRGDFGGDVAVESTPGQGATFTVRLFGERETPDDA